MRRKFKPGPNLSPDKPINKKLQSGQGISGQALKSKQQNEQQTVSPAETGEDRENFKWVRNRLKLNQSAFTPNKEDVIHQKLEDLANRSENILLRISTVFPFTFFVHDIIVDPYKVNIIFRNFFYSEQIHSVMIRDILDVVVETSVFFATLKIVDQGYTENSINIGYLKKSEALKARKIIQGLVIAHRQGVDLSQLKPEKFQDDIENIGKVKEIDDPADKKDQTN